MGTVIHGTFRPQDLIPAFLSELRERSPEAYSQIVSTPFGAVPAYVMDEGENDPWWGSEEAQFLIEELIGALNEAAPEGHYFGAHEGDGSDFGFWPEED